MNPQDYFRPNIIDGTLYYEFPYAPMYIRTMPVTCIHDYYYIAVRRITDEVSAAAYLQQLIDESFPLGLHFFIYIEDTAALPASFQAAIAKLLPTHTPKVYTVPFSTSPYDGERLLYAFGF